MGCSCDYQGPGCSCPVGCSLWGLVQRLYGVLMSPGFVRCPQVERDRVWADYGQARERYMLHVWLALSSGKSFSRGLSERE